MIGQITLEESSPGLTPPSVPSHRPFLEYPAGLHKVFQILDAQRQPDYKTNIVIHR